MNWSSLSNSRSRKQDCPNGTDDKGQPRHLSSWMGNFTGWANSPYRNDDQDPLRHLPPRTVTCQGPERQRQPRPEEASPVMVELAERVVPDELVNMDVQERN